MVSKCLQDEVDILFVFLNGVGENCNVALVDSTAFADVFSKDVVHESLETGRCIPKALRHNCPFIQPKRSLNRSLVNIAWLHTDLIEGVHQIDLATNDGMNEEFQDLILTRE